VEKTNRRTRMGVMRKNTVYGTQYTVQSLVETERFVVRLTATLKGGDVLGLVGPLGAGKTTITQIIALALGVKQRPRSPSYTVLQPYSLPKEIRGIKTLVHVDAYRVNGTELMDAGLSDYLTDPHSLIVVEWADRVKDVLPSSTTFLSLASGHAPNQRLISTSKP